MASQVTFAPIRKSKTQEIDISISVSRPPSLIPALSTMSSMSAFDGTSEQTIASRWHPFEERHVKVPPPPPPSMALSAQFSGMTIPENKLTITMTQAMKLKKRAKQFITSSNMSTLIRGLKYDRSDRTFNDDPEYTIEDLLTKRMFHVCERKDCTYMRKNDDICQFFPITRFCNEEFLYNEPPCFRPPKWDDRTALKPKYPKKQTVRLQTSLYQEYLSDREILSTPKVKGKTVTTITVPRYKKEVKTLMHAMWPCRRIPVPQKLFPDDQNMTQ